MDYATVFVFSCLTTWLSENQPLADWLAAIGTLAAVVVSLLIAFKSRSNLKTLLKVMAIPTQISLHERAAQRLAKNGNINPQDRDDQDKWIVPADKRALKRVINGLEKQKNGTPNEKKNRNIDLLIPHLEVLIKLHKELECVTGIQASDPDDDAESKK
jgi:hypothetical protein